MKYAAALVALAGTALALPQPQGVTQDLKPTAAAPSGCQPTYAGSFSITILNATTNQGVSKRNLLPRQEESGGAADTLLTLTLADGKLTDQQGRTGYIASNYQLQFDKPPQAGTIYNDGFSACANGSLALGGSAVFYGCQSGEGASKFYNFYDRNWGTLCSPIYINIIKGTSGTAAASQKSDGQPAATSAVSIRSDGQPVATSAVSIRSDGQPVAPTAVSIRSDGQPIAPSAVSIRSDGQPVAPTAVSIRSDGQPVAPSAVSIRSDGQPIVPTPVAPQTPVSIRSDGQPIATGAGTPAPSPTPVSIRSDGQPVATGAATPVSTPTAVSIRSDGQPIATAAGTPTTPAASTPTPSQFTGAANRVGSGVALVGAAVVAVAML